jgi:hypothetical protein
MEGRVNSSAPIVTFTGGGGHGAAASATVANGAVDKITVTDAGSGYTSTPTVVIASSAQVTFDPTADFSTKQNPNGVWSYGWMSTDQNTFNIHTSVFSDSFRCWLSLLDAVVGLWWFEPLPDFPLGCLYLQPDRLGEASVARWTAPASGRVRIHGRFGQGHWAVT